MRIGTTETFMQFGIAHYREIPDANDPAISGHEKELLRIALTCAALAPRPLERGIRRTRLHPTTDPVTAIGSATWAVLARNWISQSKESR